MKTKGERLGWDLASKAKYEQASKGKTITLNFRKISKEELEANRRPYYKYLIP